MTVTSCFVYKVIRNLESIDLDSHQLKWSVQVNVLLSNCKQSITSLSLLVGTTVVGMDRNYPKWVRCLFRWFVDKAVMNSDTSTIASQSATNKKNLDLQRKDG